MARASTVGVSGAHVNQMRRTHSWIKKRRGCQGGRVLEKSGRDWSIGVRVVYLTWRDTVANETGSNLMVSFISQHMQFEMMSW